jgi:hypothetical protein
VEVPSPLLLLMVLTVVRLALHAQVLFLHNARLVAGFARQICMHLTALQV